MIILVLLVAIPLSIYLVRQTQILKGRATNNSRIEFLTSAGAAIPDPASTDRQDIKVRVVFEPPTNNNPTATPGTPQTGDNTVAINLNQGSVTAAITGNGVNITRNLSAGAAFVNNIPDGDYTLTISNIVPSGFVVAQITEGLQSNPNGPTSLGNLTNTVTIKVPGIVTSNNGLTFKNSVVWITTSTTSSGAGGGGAFAGYGSAGSPNSSGTGSTSTTTNVVPVVTSAPGGTTGSTGGSIPTPTTYARKSLGQACSQSIAFDCNNGLYCRFAANNTLGEGYTCQSSP